MSSSTIGERIRALRTTKKWSLRELASRTGFTAAYLSMIERGERGTTLETLEQIAGAFSVSPGLLQDESVELDKLAEISDILSKLRSMKASQIHAVNMIIEAIRASS